MAMQTGVSSSKVLILLGAGLTGSVILRSGRLSDVVMELQELIKGINNVEVPMHYNGALLAAQIRQLVQEVRELTLSRPVTVFHGESNSSGNLSSYLLPAAAVGAMGYCYMLWKGLSFSDVMFVTKRNMANAVTAVSKQLEQVSAALASTRKHLSQRLENLDDKVEEQKETSRLILNEVNEAKTGLSQIGFDLEELQRMISGLEGKIGLIEEKQETTNAGVWYLCQIAGGIKDGFTTKFCQGAATKSYICNSNSTFSNELSAKGLQFLTETLEAGETFKTAKTEPASAKDEGNRPLKTVLTKTNAIHRSYPHGISVAADLF